MADTPTEPGSSAEADPLDAAAARLKAACERVAARVRRLEAEAEEASAGVQVAQNSDEDRARLAEALDAAHAREAALEESAREASEAMGEAIAALRALDSEPAPAETIDPDSPAPEEVDAAPARGASLFGWDEAEDGDELGEDDVGDGGGARS